VVKKLMYETQSENVNDDQKWYESENVQKRISFSIKTFKGH